MYSHNDETKDGMIFGPQFCGKKLKKKINTILIKLRVGKTVSDNSVRHNNSEN